MARRSKRSKSRSKSRRRNPIRGASFVRNPGKKSRRSKSRRRNGVAALAAKLRANRKHRKHNRRRNRRNPVRVLNNGSKRRRFSFKARKNATILYNGKRRYGKKARRRNATILYNGKRRGFHKVKAHYRKNTRRNGGTSIMGIRLPSFGGILKPVTGLLNKLPGGKFIGHNLPVALAGALSVVPLHFALKYGKEYVGDRIAAMLPASLAPVVDFAGKVQYTIGGMLVAALASKLPMLSASQKKTLAISAVTVGAGADASRFLSEKYGWGLNGIAMSGVALAGYGDGGAYNVVPYNGLALAGASDYSDASPLDAAYSGPDFSMREGMALRQGPGAWRSVFGPPAIRVTNAGQPYSRHAGREGHRWGWLLKAYGFEGAASIAALPPEQRVKVIAQLRQQAAAAVPAAIAAVQAQADASDLSGVAYAGLAYVGR